MRTTSQFLLTFLLNACWQIPLIACLASVGSHLLRTSSARYRHLLWVSALVLSLLLPLLTSSRMLTSLSFASNTPAYTNVGGELTPPFNLDVAPAAPATSWWSFQLSWNLTLALFAFYFLFLIFSSIKLALAWQATRKIRRNAFEIGPSRQIAEAVETCATAIPLAGRSITVLCSETVPVPITIGVAKPVVILPEELLQEENSELITSAIGHEFVHI